jgi:hypothetical protein
MSHVDEPVHMRLHDEPHEPEHAFMFAQSSVQLAPHVPSEIVHDWPDGQVHDAPVHFGGVPSLPPHAANNRHRPKVRLLTIVP